MDLRLRLARLSTKKVFQERMVGRLKVAWLLADLPVALDMEIWVWVWKEVPDPWCPHSGSETT